MHIIDGDMLYKNLKEIYIKNGFEFREVHFSLNDMEMNILAEDEVFKLNRAQGKLKKEKEGVYRCDMCKQEIKVPRHWFKRTFINYNYCPICGGNVRCDNGNS